MIESPIRKDNCIRTFSGLYIDVFKPTANMICIEDIAHGLSHTCRFSGQIPIFWSVASHSIWCSYYVEHSLRLATLLHDASEAYLTDIPSPIKRNLKDYQKIENRLMKVIANKFGFDYPLHYDVKEVDNLALHSEWKWFYGKEKLYQHPNFDNPSPEITKQNFINRFHEITKL